MIAAAVLALVAILVLSYVFLAAALRPPTNQTAARSSPSPLRPGKEPPPGEGTGVDESTIPLAPVVYNRVVPEVGDANRNILLITKRRRPRRNRSTFQRRSPTPTRR
jgi:hypothetical protein